MQKLKPLKKVSFEILKSELLLDINTLTGLYAVGVHQDRVGERLETIYEEIQDDDIFQENLEKTIKVIGKTEVNWMTFKTILFSQDWKIDYNDDGLTIVADFKMELESLLDNYHNAICDIFQVDDVEDVLFYA